MQGKVTLASFLFTFGGFWDVCLSLQGQWTENFETRKEKHALQRQIRHGIVEDSLFRLSASRFVVHLLRLDKIRPTSRKKYNLAAVQLDCL